MNDMLHAGDIIQHLNLLKRIKYWRIYTDKKQGWGGNMQKKILLVSLIITLAAAIMISVVIFGRNSNIKQSSSNLNNSASIEVSNGNSSSSSSDGMVPIYPDDTGEIKKKKEEYNKIALQGKQLGNEYVNGKISKEEFLKQSEQLRKKLDATGINPKDYVTPEQKYEERYECNILDKEMLDNDCRDDNGKIIPKYKDKYELNIKRKEYIEKIHNDFKAGKISAKEAEKSLTDQYTLIK